VRVSAIPIALRPRHSEVLQKVVNRNRRASAYSVARSRTDPSTAPSHDATRDLRWGWFSLRTGSSGLPTGPRPAVRPTSRRPPGADEHLA
jgi:hypothetical protein